ncbi:nucleoside 2-deoxyribosyltransferase [Bradyrhizobium sp. CCGB01]|uniref:nucleoside 2-deoxyribosyltransferase n=1 Tax=Bradyrhizobium sp. CCGB01 TaxID=2949634 RepID=UPI0020B1FFD6|nr:nucleoside 2-deoxyribosyltransferase [Bradyrhizobium sp. CCGB01]MCP3411204.1 nucleoside 2-deoxyribosyltransferase [Bradyrhizobium sp. CCGB01]
MQRSKEAVRKKAAAANGPGSGGAAKFPRHSIERALRIPRAIIEQNAGKESSEAEAAAYVGVGLGGPFRVEISSAIKYGLLSRPRAGYVDITERARQAVRPQKPGDDIESLRQGVLEAPEISEVYKHYRGEDLPDGAFFTNALVDKFKIPSDKVAEFISIFMSSLESAHLIEKRGDKSRILDITSSEDLEPEAAPRRTAGATPKIAAGDSCFVVMPFAGAIGGYFHHVYEPAIKKAGLVAVRADADIFGTGKIIDQIWSGINAAKVLVAELTTKNPNVFYELGLAHALNKPVVLVSSNEEDVPFDLRHIRVIYYDVRDPFWGQKLIEKVAENIVSALKNPEEAVFKRALESK